MFLTQLNQDIKPLFIHLASLAAEASGECDDVQEKMISIMADEMNIPPVYDDGLDEKQLLSRIVAYSEEEELRIMMFEMLGILFSDEAINDGEVDFIERVRHCFGMEQDEVEHMLELIGEYNHLYLAILKTIFRG